MITPDRPAANNTEKNSHPPMAERIALFGGSFNPIHNGHLIIARSVAEQLRVDRMLLIPSRRPPHKTASSLLDAEHRAAMIRLAIAGEASLDMSDYELTSEGTNYTIDSVAHFREEFGLDVSLYLVIGVDSLNELTSWYRVRALADACRIVTAKRPGWEEINWPQLAGVLSEEQMAILKCGVLDTPRIEISSTDIRRRIREGRSIRYLVPAAVREHIESNRLYLPETAGV